MVPAIQILNILIFYTQRYLMHSWEGQKSFVSMLFSLNTLKTTYNVTWSYNPLMNWSRRRCWETSMWEDVERFPCGGENVCAGTADAPQTLSVKIGSKDPVVIKIHRTNYALLPNMAKQHSSICQAFVMSQRALTSLPG